MKNLVVGVDGSVDSLAALEWAARMVGPSGTVHVVHALAAAGELLGVAARVEGAQRRLDAERQLAERWITPERAGGATLIGHLPADAPSDALLRVAEDCNAEGVVVGAHGRSLLVPRTVGSVTTQLLHKTVRPLLVVRHDAAGVPATDGTIVVGVGHREATDAAVRWAAALALDAGMALSLVRATAHRPVFDENGLLEVIAYYLDPSKLREWAQEDLAELAMALEESTDHRLPVSWTTPSGRPGPRLVEAAAGASLLVIGKHHDGILTDHFTVPALHHALTHAPCPVAVVPQHLAGTEAPGP